MSIESGISGRLFGCASEGKLNLSTFQCGQKGLSYEAREESGEQAYFFSTSSNAGRAQRSIWTLWPQRLSLLQRVEEMELSGVAFVVEVHGIIAAEAGVAEAVLLAV